jgi:hypothetical protein
MTTQRVKSFRINTGFTKGRDNDVCNLSLDTEDALLNNPVFLKLPVSLADLATYRVAFSAAMVEARKGGTDRTRLKKAAKLVLVDALMKNAFYCQGEARHERDALLSSGYDIVSSNRTPSPLDQAAIRSIANNISGQLTVRGQSVVNGRLYQARTSTDGGQTWLLWPQCTGARLMVLQPVIPGTIYRVEFCALGGSTGQGPWSNPVTIMAT